MTFKIDWEKTQSEYTLPKQAPQEMVYLAYPDKKILSHHMISGGCANINFKIQIEGLDEPVILRVYLRDEKAICQEQHLGALLGQEIPVPITYFRGTWKGYTFAITKFLEGIPLRDLLLSPKPHDLSALMCEVGECLGKIAHHEFSSPGFFDQNLGVVSETSTAGYMSFVLGCLKNSNTTSQLSADIIFKITQHLETNEKFFLGRSDRNLVHGDFDPGNILVHIYEGRWRVSGILDWEFAFSGSILWDVANMLRYAHDMPQEYESGFLKGLKQGDVILPENWKSVVNTLNLISLLDLLSRSNPKKNSIKCTDIRMLIMRILEKETVL